MMKIVKYKDVKVKDVKVKDVKVKDVMEDRVFLEFVEEKQLYKVEKFNRVHRNFFQVMVWVEQRKGLGKTIHTKGCLINEENKVWVLKIKS